MKIEIEEQYLSQIDAVILVERAGTWKNKTSTYERNKNNSKMLVRLHYFSFSFLNVSFFKL